MKKLLIISALAAVMVASGCSASEETAQKEDSGSKDASTTVVSPAAGDQDTKEGSKAAATEPSAGNKDASTKSETPVKESLQVNAYVTDDQITTLIAEPRTISVENGKYMAAVAELGKANDAKHIALLPDFKVNEIMLDGDGTLKVDISGNNSYNLGADGEQLAVEALSKTLLQFEEVKAVQLLIDGKQAESLAGHVDISQPFTK